MRQIPARSPERVGCALEEQGPGLPVQAIRIAQKRGRRAILELDDALVGPLEELIVTD
jgi:hypothetical protein